MGRKSDLIGHRFGRLVVIGDSGRRSTGNVCWTCRCDCGNTVDVRTASLRDGATTSCGCNRREKAPANFATIPNKVKFRQYNRTNGTRISKSAAQKNNKCGIRGVCQARSHGKLRDAWVAYIDYKRHRYHLGIYDTIEEAAAVRAEAAKARLKDFEDWYAEFVKARDEQPDGDSQNKNKPEH